MGAGERSVSVERLKKLLRKGTWDLHSTLKARSHPSLKVLYEGPGQTPEFPPEFVHHLCEPAYIEPQFGYIITESGRLLLEPHCTTDTFGVRPWRYGVPSPARYFRTVRNRPANILHFPAVISLRFLWEWNYFHFYEDVLGKLARLDRAGVDLDIPIVLGKYAAELPFVRQIIQQGKFRDRNWIIPDENTYIHADSILYASAQRDDLRAKYDYILSQMQPPGPFPQGDARTFLTRKKARNRSIVNIDAVEELLTRYGFRSVDTSEMTIPEQMELFAQTRFLIGIHGAGLINLIFRQACPFDMIELHGDSYCSADFRDRAAAYGYGWDDLGGVSEPGDPQHANFQVPLQPLEEKITQMLTR